MNCSNVFQIKRHKRLLIENHSVSGYDVLISNQISVNVLRIRSRILVVFVFCWHFH